MSGRSLLPLLPALCGLYAAPHQIHSSDGWERTPRVGRVGPKPRVLGLLRDCGLEGGVEASDWTDFLGFAHSRRKENTFLNIFVHARQRDKLRVIV